jgi:hypothetical protein
MLTLWKFHHPRMTFDMLGLIPLWLDVSDPRPAAEQLNANYQHGGGWRPFSGFTFNPESRTLYYPGDPPMKPLAEAPFRDETIFFYPHSWIMILQKDGTFEISRMD